MKFRSWNKEKKEFAYFEDGEYLTFTPFNWQNAEQEFERYNIKFFIGDKFSINEAVYGVIVIRNGVLEFDKYETCCDEYIGYSRITDYYINQLEKIGNIHEEKR